MNMKLTVKELIELLQVEDPELEITFGGLDFYRLKVVGENLNFEFNQTVYKNDETGDVILENH